jgi:hypothetical protein
MSSLEAQASPAVKVMALRRPGACRCGTPLAVGTRAGWDRTLRVVVCLDCLDCLRDGLHPRVPELRVPELSVPEPKEPLPTVVDIGEPGCSLQAQFERRSGARAARVRERSPRIGGFLLAVFPDPASTLAFSKGATGERRVAACLAERSGPGVLFLHNRKLGRGRRDGDVDHMALTPGGVYVIDAKLYKNAKVRVRRTGGLFSPVREQLMVNGRDRSKLLDSVARQNEAVREAIATFQDLGVAAGGVPVISVLCFVDADLPMFGTPRIDGVPLLGSKGTARLLRESTGSLDQDTLAALHRHLAEAMPPA